MRARPINNYYAMSNNNNKSSWRRAFFLLFLALFIIAYLSFTFYYSISIIVGSRKQQQQQDTHQPGTISIEQGNGLQSGKGNDDPQLSDFQRKVKKSIQNRVLDVENRNSFGNSMRGNAKEIFKNANIGGQSATDDADLKSKNLRVEQEVSSQSSSNQDKQPKQSNRKFPDHSANDDDIHIVFSTGCNLFQHWQAEVLLQSFLRVGQRGKITRIVSGCETEHLKRDHNNFLTHPEGLGDRPMTEEELRTSANPRFHLHITPSFPKAKEFPWINKPMGIHHWLFNANPPVNETTIIIIDPDMFFQDKMTQDGTDTLESGRVICTLGCSRNEWMGKPIDKSILSSRASKGKPVAQLYGLGGAWVHKFDIKKICGEDSPALKWTSDQGYKYFSAGPPYILHIEDMRALMPLWVKYMYPVYDRDPGDIQADMYAYILAAAHLNLPHLLLDHFMISSPATEGEGWDWIERIPTKYLSCRDPFDISEAVTEAKMIKSAPILLPTFQHIAQRYDVPPMQVDKDASDPERRKLWMFHKGHVPANIFQCELPLLKLPPEDLLKVRRNNKASQADNHRAFMLCAAYNQINHALTKWKEKFCDLEKAVYRRHFMLQPSFRPCNAPKQDGVDCWVFAKWESDVQDD